MGISQFNFEGKNKVEVAIMRLKEFEPSEGYFGAFSGGKDSCVIKGLAEEAEVKVDWHFNISGIDPKELLAFIRENHPDVGLIYPAMPIFKAVVKHGLPRRNARWCCELIKETAGKGRTVLTGVRWAESVRRRVRRMYEVCRTDDTKMFLHPIIDWTDTEVWEYIHSTNLPYCLLYDEGFKRIGCILCPMASQRITKKECERFPKVAEAWRRAAIRLWEDRKAKGSPSVDRWASGDEMFKWWLTRSRKVDDAQCVMFE